MMLLAAERLLDVERVGHRDAPTIRSTATATSNANTA